MKETYLSNLYREKVEDKGKLTEKERQEEIEFLISQKEPDKLLSLFILEYLSNINNDEVFVDTAFKMLSQSPRNAIYNLKILKLINKNKFYVPITNKIFEIFDSLKVSSNEEIEVDWNTLKIENENVGNRYFIEFVIKKGIKILLKSLYKISNSMSFPGICTFLIEKLRKYSFEGDLQSYFTDSIKILKEQKVVVLKHLTNIKNIKYTEKEIQKIELNIPKFLNL